MSACYLHVDGSAMAHATRLAAVSLRDSPHRARVANFVARGASCSTDEARGRARFGEPCREIDKRAHRSGLDVPERREESAELGASRRARGFERARSSSTAVTSDALHGDGRVSNARVERARVGRDLAVEDRSAHFRARREIGKTVGHARAIGHAARKRNERRAIRTRVVDRRELSRRALVAVCVACCERNHHGLGQQLSKACLGRAHVRISASRGRARGASASDARTALRRTRACRGKPNRALRGTFRFCDRRRLS